MKKLLSVLLTIVLLTSVVPISLFQTTVSAATMEYTEGDYTYIVTDGVATIVDVNTSIRGNITIPSTLGGYAVSVIGEYAFSVCSDLTSITFPNSIKSIEKSAFYYFRSLTNIIFLNDAIHIGGHSV